MSIFRSAVEGVDGTVDPGYLAMYWGISCTVAMIPLSLLFGLWLAAVKPADQAEKILSSVAMIVGALGVQGAAIIAAVGVFRMGDKDRGPQPTPPQQVTVNAAPPSEISIGTKTEG